ncbi:MAG: zinc ABC transporter substrate-binding protein, partial [Myxococcales bacterium]|nr:zinc ABC transporter substrate-binding protein [Myxococcales bacterium]
LPLEYVVDRLAGEFVETAVMLPPGASPTQYQPTLGQVRAFSDAAVYVKVGHPNFPFEAAWLDRLLGAASDVAVVDASSGLTDLAGDPHLWLAPKHVAAIASEVATALAPRLPGHEAELTRNLATLQRQIGALDLEIEQLLAPVVASGRRTFVVQHPAWGHFAAAYGLEQVAVEEDHHEPDPHALSERIAWAREHGVRVVFIQPQLDPTPAETLAREIGARVVPLDPLAYDWAANLRAVALAIREGLTR